MVELDPRFKIRAPLRCDGIGRLDCAEDLESGMRMAVRWLPLEANGTAAVQACEQLPEHPTLPRIRQIGKMGTSAYVAMEFPDGNLLATRAHEVLDSGTLIAITAQIADALASIHSQEVFHGEMSADSVLLVTSPSEKAFLWDMPLVIANRLTDRRGEERLMTQLVKTAPFLAPERARGAKAAAESDVYALGAIICVAGGAPLPVAETTLGVVHAVVSGTWVPKVPKTIPEPLRSMLERMVASNPAERPTAREVADLFMPPVAAHTTLPEMAAVILPPAAPVVMAEAKAIPVIDAQVPSKVDASMLEVNDPLEATIPEAKATAPMPRTSGAAMPAVVMAPAVALTDNVSVSSELHEAGAVLLTAEEAAMMPRPSRKGPMVMAAVMGVLVMVLAALAIDLAHKAPTPQVASPVMVPTQLKKAHASAANVAPTMAPAAAESDDDLLSALPPSAPHAAKKLRRAPRPSSQLSPQEEPAAEKSADFGFLEEEQELKRPSF
jgi:hypothetical protein